MPLPEDARLMADGIEIPSTKNYMIDCNGTVYAYIEELDAAVKSEILIACTTDGKHLLFHPDSTHRKTVLSCEEVINKIHN